MTNINFNSSSYNFDPLSDNDGQIVGRNYYFNQNAMNRELSNSIMEQIGGGKRYGFNLANVVSALVEGEMGGTIPSLQRQITNTNVRISAVAKLENLISRLQTTTLIPLEAGLSPYSIQSSDPSKVIASITNGSSLDQVDPFTVNTTALAQADVWVFSTAYASKDTTVNGSGILTIDFGSGDSTEVTISADSTLETIAHDINNADGVKALVVRQNDGYHLVVSSSQTGAEEDLSFSFNADPDSGDLETLFTNKNNTQVAQDADYSINGIDITSSTNHVTYDGINITLNAAGATAIVSTNVQTNHIAQAVNGFVANYNELITTINELGAMTPGKNGVGSLFQDGDLKKVINAITDTILKVQANNESLYSLGIDVNTDRTLSLNQGKLALSLQSEPGLADRVFATHTSATDLNVQVVNYQKVADTVFPETASGTYDIDITQMATKASHQVTNALTFNGNSKVDLTADTTLKMLIKGQQSPGSFNGELRDVEVEINLLQGEYSKEELIANIQAQINANSEVQAAHGEIDVSLNNDHLVFTSENYGSYFGFNFLSEDSVNLAELGIAEVDLDAEDDYLGLNVHGTINGQLSLADGQYLQAQKDTSVAAAGITIKVTGGVIGSRGTVSISRGYSDDLDGLLGGYVYHSELNPDKSGLLAKKEYDYRENLNNSNLSSLTTQLKEAQARKEKLTERYFHQYKEVNATLAKFDAEQNYIKNMFGRKNND